MGALNCRARRIARALAVTATAAGLILAGAINAPTASAAAPAVIQRPATGVTADALPTVQINGVVWDQVIVGDVVYAGGQFTSARPAGAPAGTSESPRSNLLAYSLSTGQLITGFAPSFNGVIKALAVSPDKTRLYVGGDFSVVDGKSRSRLAVFTITAGGTGALLAGFAPVFNTRVNALAVSNTAIYAGGWFTAVNSTPRSRLVAISPTTGAVLPWAPSANYNVNALTLSPDQSRLIVGGQFTALNTTTAYGLGAVDTGAGAATVPWAVNTLVRDSGTNSGITGLKTVGNVVYGTGYRYGTGNGTFEGVFAASPNNGNVIWLQDCHGDSYDVTVTGGLVYAVSHAHDCSNIGGWPNDEVDYQHNTAVTVDARGTVNRNTATGYSNFAGQPAPALVNWFPTFAVGSFTGQYQAGWTVESTSSYVVQGGEFTKVNGVPQQGLVRFAVPTVAAKKQGPVVAPTISARYQFGTLRFTTTASWDRDDQVLTYRVYREGVATPVCTTTATSQFWNRPTVSCSISNPARGTYRYRIGVSDPDGNTLYGPYVSVRV
jgi:hypothetical protein